MYKMRRHTDTGDAVSRLIWLLVASFHFGLAWAQQELALPQLSHRVFSVDQGAPSASFALAQTSDGTLWIGSTQGLYRFDGARFVRYPQPEEWPVSSGNVWSLLAAGDSGLWIGYRFGGVSRLKDGSITHFAESDGLPPGPVIQFEVDSSGVLWLATQTGLANFTGSTWQRDSGAADLKTIVSFLIDRRGSHWIATPEGLHLRRAGEERFHKVDHRHFLPYGRGVLAEAPDGKVWASTQDGLIRLDDQGGTPRSMLVPVRGYEKRILRPVMFDREGNLWGAPLAAGGVLRVPAREISQDAGDPLNGEFIASADSLGPRSVFTLFEDREGNIWSTSAEGISRFSRGKVVRDPHECPIPAAMAAADHGGLWIGCRTESAIWLLRPGLPDRRLATSAFTAAYRDHEGEIWFAGPRSVGRLRGSAIHETALPPEASGAPIQVLLRDHEGGIWLSAPLRGLFRWSAGTWLRNGGLAGLPTDPATAAAVQPDGTIWLGFRQSRVARIREGQVQVFGPQQGLNIGTVLALTARGTSVWIGGERGIGVFAGGQFAMIGNADGTSFGAVSGIVAARSGDIWLNGTNGISRIRSKQISAVQDNASRTVNADMFDYRDGVPGVAIVYDTLPSAIEGTDGRIWFATTAGLVSIDEQTLNRNDAPPPVTIWSVSSDGHKYRVARDAIHLPAGATRLTVDYSAGALTAPERVRFMYRLEGIESSWQDAGNNRVATYTNLGPGNYRFRVIAANEDGVWNETGASVAIAIAPAWYQTRWFSILCWLALGAIVLMLYRLRMRRVSAQIIVRLEARMAERERIARELHDTLLQTFQGLVLRLQTAVHIWPSEDGRRILGDGIDQAAKAITEGRNAVLGLRSPSERSDLEGAVRALAAVVIDESSVVPTRLSVEVQGRARRLNPVVQEETFRIVAEALRNAARHADARRIEVDIRYDKRELHVLVRDDGKGIDRTIIRRGRAGHLGLHGMRERAKLIGAKLIFRSRIDSGTEIALVVPAGRAYAKRDLPGAL